MSRCEKQAICTNLKERKEKSMAEVKNYFQELYDVNVNDKTEKKNGLTYLSWAFAWAEIKKRHPMAFYTIYENADGWNYFTDGRTAWVKTGVTIDGLEHIEYLPVMDYKNQSIPADKLTSFDVNKTIQRSLTKACARHGLGLYVYGGEDLPEADKPICADCGAEIRPEKGLSVDKLVSGTTKSFGKPLCYACSLKAKAAKEAEKKEEVK